MSSCRPSTGEWVGLHPMTHMITCQLELDETAAVATLNSPFNIMRACRLMLCLGAVFVLPLFSTAEETRMAVWKDQKDGPPQADWIENGKLPDLLKEYN